MDFPFDLTEIISRQLGRKPAIAFTVAVKCPFGWPAVLLNEAFTAAGEPNPNIYYLSCPHLRREVARLEDAGLIAGLEETLRSDTRLAADVTRAQSEHRQEWLRASQKGEDRQKSGPADKPGGGKIPAPNIAAARNDLSIKCLHAHMAWFLAHPDYLLGRLIAERLVLSFRGSEATEESALKYETGPLTSLGTTFSLEEIWCKDELCRRFFK